MKLFVKLLTLASIAAASTAAWADKEASFTPAQQEVVEAYEELQKTGKSGWEYDQEIAEDNLERACKAAHCSLKNDGDDFCSKYCSSKPKTEKPTKSKSKLKKIRR